MSISGKLIDVAKNARDIKALYDSQKGKNVEQYQYAEAVKVINKIRAFRSSSPNSIVFGVISDTHVFEDGSQYVDKTERAIDSASFALNNIASFVNADFIANLGDNQKENNIDSQSAQSAAEYLNDSVVAPFKNHAAFRLVGNHDQSNSAPDTTYELNGKYNSFDNHGYDIKRGYGYKDFNDKKLRVICLNTSDYYHRTGGYDMSYGQKRWFMSALDLSSKSNPDDWSIILLSHIPLDYPNHSLYNTVNDVKAILNAYTNGTSVSISVNESYANAQNETSMGGVYTYNYSGKNQAKIIGNFHGHIHNDAVGKMQDNEVYRISSNNTSGAPLQNGSVKEGDVTYTATGSYAKQQGTANETSVTFYVVDTDNRVIHAVQYGAGIDREISYGNAQVFTVTNSLSNATTGNNTSSAAEQTLYSATITADTDCVISSYSVTMGGIDITETCVNVSGNSVIINIPNVTGDISITVTAVAEQYTCTVTDLMPIIRMYWSGNSPKIPANSNAYCIFGVSTPNGLSYTGRSELSSPTFYAMPLPSKATKVTINVDDSISGLKYNFTICNNVNNTLSKVTETLNSDSNVYSFAKGSGQYICLSVQRTDGNWAWDYDLSKFSVTFSN